ncbi:putative quinol monooxygenase [Azospirillum picis]|uniref:Quinol monooxygenase YgiN n=1 Tax=Azospirillum picis TaxID=488438 RepID=A0ABU0MML0_9PROT|nr:putative quinol monooxygenase [Azospirillum picis]MBP2300708.1 quinol monooxygenase YgiN [Azospirillum picis]MDQ0534677.1 quinol monooxygenase YgiN [Azospirillum picis]
MTVPPADQVQLVAYLVAKPGQEQALADAITAIVPAVLQEPGCLAYNAHVSREAPGTIVMYEVWQDKAALDAHAAAANFKGLAAQFDTLLNEPLRIDTLRRIA